MTNLLVTLLALSSIAVTNSGGTLDWPLSYTEMAEICGKLANKQTDPSCQKVEMICQHPEDLQNVYGNSQNLDIKLLDEIKQKKDKSTCIIATPEQLPVRVFNNFSLSPPAQPPAPSSALRPLWGPSPSTLIWGTTDFIVNRGVEEIESWLAKRLVNRFCDDSIAGIKFGDIFTKSCSVLKKFTISGLDYQLKLFSAAMKEETFKLPLFLVKQGINGKILDDSSAYLAYSILFITSNLANHNNFAAVIGDLIDNLPAPPANFLSADVLTLYAMSVMANSIPFDKKTSEYLSATAHENEVKIMLPATMIININNAGVKTKWKKYFPTNYSSNIIYQKALTTAKNFVDNDKLENLTAPIADIADAIRTKDISPAILARLWTVLNYFFVFLPDSNSTIKKIADIINYEIVTSFLKNDYTGAMNGIVKLIEIIDPNTKIPTYIYRYIEFALKLCQANDSAEISSIISDFAAPVGSYARKRRDAEGCYLTLNAYLAGIGGWEHSVSDSWSAPGWGIYAPVGVELGNFFGSPSSGLSYALLLHPVDLGVPLAFHIDNEKIGSNSEDDTSTEAYPELSFYDIFSPGAVFLLGLPDMPFSVGLSGSYLPRIRKIVDTAEDGTKVERCEDGCDVWRLGLMFGVDITLFP